MVLPGALISCSDGVRNGGEAGIDCGGTCSEECFVSTGTGTGGFTIQLPLCVGLLVAVSVVMTMVVVVVTRRRRRLARDRVSSQHHVTARSALELNALLLQGHVLPCLPLVCASQSLPLSPPCNPLSLSLQVADAAVAGALGKLPGKESAPAGPALAPPAGCSSGTSQVHCHTTSSDSWGAAVPAHALPVQVLAGCTLPKGKLDSNRDVNLASKGWQWFTGNASMSSCKKKKKGNVRSMQVLSTQAPTSSRCLLPF
jgi:hypothetical protein